MLYKLNVGSWVVKLAGKKVSVIKEANKKDLGNILAVGLKDRSERCHTEKSYPVV